MKKNSNYLEYIPIKNDTFPWWENEKGIIVVRIERKGFFNKIAQRFFRIPKYSEIKLDIYGSFVWKVIDEDMNILEIGELVKKEFGKNADPLYERLVKFFQILHNNKFIKYKN